MPTDQSTMTSPQSPNLPVPNPPTRLRLHFAKGERLKYIAHLDLARTWERAFRRAGLPVVYSQGFNPRPRFQIAAALPVGVTGSAELLDVWLGERQDPEQVLARLREVLPAGLEVLGIEEVDLRAPSLQSQMRAADYVVNLESSEPVTAIQARIRELLAAPVLLRQRQHKGKLQSYDLRPLIQDLAVEQGAGAGQVTLRMHLQASPHGAGRPDQVLEALGLALAAHTIERTRLYFEFDK